MESEPLGQELSDQDRVLLVFGYLGPLGSLVALVASRREFVKWHAKQGLVLSAFAALAYVLLRGPRLRFHPVIADVLSASAWLIVSGMVMVALICIIRALEGERFKVPLLGDIVDRL